MTPDVITIGASDDPEAADARMSIELWRTEAPSGRLAVHEHARHTSHLLLVSPFTSGVRQIEARE